jgi:uncharacterized membrane protein YphA (DoxX/SURF4 family)
MASKPIATDVNSRRPQDGAASPRPRRGLHYTLWTLQVLLALLFLFAGVTKFVMSPEEMAQQAQSQGQAPLPILFLQFIGVAEILGGLGLLLPGLLRIRTGLTPLAAAGLVIVMAGATVITLTSNSPAGAAIPLVVGLLAAFVAYGRWRLVPLRGR